MVKARYFLALIISAAVFSVIIIMPHIKQVASKELIQEQSLPAIGTFERLRSILTEVENSRASLGQRALIGTE